MTSDEKDLGHCAWCRLPKGRKGIVLGVLGSVLVHAALLGAVAYSAGEKNEIRPARTIYVGTFVIKARKPEVSRSTAEREI